MAGASSHDSQPSPLPLPLLWRAARATRWAGRAPGLLSVGPVQRAALPCGPAGLQSRADCMVARAAVPTGCSVRVAAQLSGEAAGGAGGVLSRNCGTRTDTLNHLQGLQCTAPASAPLRHTETDPPMQAINCLVRPASPPIAGDMAAICRTPQWAHLQAGPCPQRLHPLPAAPAPHGAPKRSSAPRRRRGTACGAAPDGRLPPDAAPQQVASWCSVSFCEAARTSLIKACLLLSLEEEAAAQAHYAEAEGLGDVRSASQR